MKQVETRRYWGVLVVEDVFGFTGKGCVVVGNTSAGQFVLGQKVEVRRNNQEIATTVIDGLETFNQTLTTASKGQNIGMLLRDIKKGDIQVNDVVYGLIK